MCYGLVAARSEQRTSLQLLNHESQWAHLDHSLSSTLSLLSLQLLAVHPAPITGTLKAHRHTPSNGAIRPRRLRVSRHLSLCLPSQPAHVVARVRRRLGATLCLAQDVGAHPVADDDVPLLYELQATAVHPAVASTTLRTGHRHVVGDCLVRGSPPGSPPGSQAVQQASVTTLLGPRFK